MKNEKTGIAVCGSVIVDKINEIRAYPASGELTKIVGLQKAVGGCVPNVGIDIKKICPELTVWAMGKIGKDDDGEYVKDVLLNNSLDISALYETTEDKTSFTEVMSVKGGQRTFFTYAGADGTLTADDIDFTGLSPKILHLGYFLLLDKIDQGEGLKLLQKAKENGIETSIDLVSENSDRYSVVIPCLPYTDYLIINEIEAGKLTNIEPTDANIEAIARKLVSMGIKKKVIIHMRDYAVCCSGDEFTAVASLDIPSEIIKGSTGAGDAFCAGSLCAIYNGKTDAEILEFASCTAAISLTSSDATSAVCTEKEIIEFCKEFKRKSINL